MMARGAVSWRSAKQTWTTTFTMEVKFISYFEAIAHDVWLKSFISRLKIMNFISKLLRIYYDNSVIVLIAKNNKNDSRSKHFDIKYLAIKECVKEKKAVIEHISTELMIADPLTKSKPLLKFKDHEWKWDLVQLCDFSCMNYIIFKQILFIVMFSYIYVHLSLFEKIHPYRTKNKHKVYSLSKVATHRIILGKLYAL